MTTHYRNEALTSALASADVAAIGHALRGGRVVLPLLDETRVRVFPGGHGEGPPYEVMVFSSVDALGLFLGDDPNRSARLQDAEELRTFLEAHRGQIDEVTFDPAGPHPLRTGVREVLAAVGPLASAKLRLPKGQTWYPVDLTTVDLRDYRLAELTQRVLPQVQKAQPELPVWEEWMARAAQEATDRGATRLAFWLQRVSRRPAGLAVALGPSVPSRGVHEVQRSDGPTTGERWVTSPDRAYRLWLAYSFPHEGLAETVLPTVDLVVATLSWGED